jgi:transcriptional regulator with XRE-family HTH domain
MLYFGVKLKILRQKKHMTQQQLADYLDITKATVSAYETSSKYPSLNILVKICKFFQVSADYLLDLSDNPHFNIAPLTDEQVAIIKDLINQFTFLNNFKEK